MSIAGLLEEQESTLDFVALEESERSSSASDDSLESTDADFSAASEGAGPELSEDWLFSDPVDEAIETLRRLGHTAEAEVIEHILHNTPGGKDDDLLMRAYVSSRWAEEWDSEEYGAYDEL
jgi:hypothetical protein